VPENFFVDGTQAFVKMFIKPKGKNALIDTNVMPHHIVSLNLTQFSGSAVTATINLFDETYDALERVILSSGLLDFDPKNVGSEGGPAVHIQFGWTGEKTVNSRMFRLAVTNYTTKFDHSSGTALELQCVGSGSSIGLTRGNFSFKEGSTVKSVVSKLAAADNLNVSVAEGTLNTDARQNGQTSFKFLQKLISNGSFVAKDKTKKWTVRINPTEPRNTLVVRPDATGTLDSVEWSYIYGRDRDGQVKSWEVELKAAALMSLGSGGMKAAIVNKGDKKASYVTTNERTVSGAAVAGNIVPDISNTPMPLRLVFENAKDAESYAANKWLRLNMTNVIGRLAVIGNPTISVDDFINVIVVKGKAGIASFDDLHETSGRYGIKSIEHSITDGDFTTSIECIRRGSLKAGAGGTVKTEGSSAAKNVVKQAGALINKPSPRNLDALIRKVVGEEKISYGAATGKVLSKMSAAVQKKYLGN